MRPRLLDATAFFGIYFVSVWKRNIGHGKIKGKIRGRVFPKKTDTKNPAKYAAKCFLKKHAPKHEAACFLVKQMTKKSSHVFQGIEWEWRYNTTSAFFASFLQLRATWMDMCFVNLYFRINKKVIRKVIFAWQMITIYTPLKKIKRQVKKYFWRMFGH